jgi:hypothetical protein
LKRRRGAIVLMLSLAAHLSLLAAWMSTRPKLTLAEPPTMVVQLLRPPPPRPKSKAAPQPPRTVAAIRPHAVTQAPPPQVEPLPIPRAPEPQSQIAPEWRVKPEAPRPGPLANGRLAGQPKFRPPPCKSSRDHSDLPGPPCPSQSPEELASHYDVAKDSRTAGFEGEGAQKRAMKRYHELPGAAGYPGIGCAIFHRC